MKDEGSISEKKYVKELEMFTLEKTSEKHISNLQKKDRAVIWKEEVGILFIVPQSKVN